MANSLVLLTDADIYRVVCEALRNPRNQEIEFGPRNLGRSEEEIKQSRDEALSAVDLYDHIDLSPFELSFDKKKRISIAAVLAMKPNLLLLVEIVVLNNNGLWKRGKAHEIMHHTHTLDLLGNPHELNHEK